MSARGSWAGRVAVATAPVLMCLSSLGVYACGGEDTATGVKSAKLPSGTRTEAIEHEACNESGNRVDVLDANNDGKADIKRVYDKSSGKEICRISDLNHDGKPDLFEYYDPGGELRRREADYDDNAVVDSVEYFEHGRLTRREYDTTGQHRIDTWDFFDATGKLARRERDATNDGRVDQWWTWDGDKVTIAIDKSGDGKPDPEETIVLGGAADAGGPAPPPGPPAPPSLDKPPTQPESSDMTPTNASSATASDAGARQRDAGGADASPKRKEKR